MITLLVGCLSFSVAYSHKSIPITKVITNGKFGAQVALTWDTINLA